MYRVSDIIAHAADYLYVSVVRELPKANAWYAPSIKPIFRKHIVAVASVANIELINAVF